MRKGDKIYAKGITLEVVSVKGEWVAFYVHNGTETKLRFVKVKKFMNVKTVA